MSSTEPVKESDCGCRAKVENAQLQEKIENLEKKIDEMENASEKKKLIVSG